MWQTWFSCGNCLYPINFTHIWSCLMVCLPCYKADCTTIDTAQSSGGTLVCGESVLFYILFLRLVCVHVPLNRESIELYTFIALARLASLPTNKIALCTSKSMQYQFIWSVWEVFNHFPYYGNWTHSTIVILQPIQGDLF